MLTQNNPAIAMILGSFAAAVECEKEGNIPVKPGDVLEKINLAEQNLLFE